MAEEKTTKRRTRRKKDAEVEAPVETAVEAKEEVIEAEDEAIEVEEEKEPEKVIVRESEKDLKDAKIEQLQQQNEFMQQQLEELKRAISDARPQVIQVSNDTERIEFLWLAPVADENELLVADGLYGKITGKVGNFSVPKNEFSRILDSATRKYIENRWLIVLGGMTPEERVMYGVDYKQGEILDKDMFMRMLDYGSDIIPKYEQLCDASKEVVAKMYYEAYVNPAQKSKVKRETVVAMHKIKPQEGFKAIIDAMNRADAE